MLTGISRLAEHTPLRLTFPIVAALLLVGLLSSLHAQEPRERVDFNRDIRPILSENCYFCHGFDDETREAGLRLDVREAAIEDRNGIHAIFPGNSGESEVYHRITAQDESDLMPPPDSERSLTEAQKELIRRWIDEGADYESHWAFNPIVKPEVPEAFERANWASNEIDAFVLRKLKEAETRSQPEADKVTLIRRLHFDLTGLPPSYEDVEAFLNDDSPEAYEKVVDELLSSPHYGERMATFWLDLVRFADTMGYHSDDQQMIFPYRDYVIRSFNKNKPFDQFTIEQIAGDLLPDATLEQKVATGYNRLNKVTGEGGAQAKEYLAKYFSDRVNTTSDVWLGMTMNCAECHKHKFDPISAEDYYSFGAFFADVQEEGVYSGHARRTGEYPPLIEVPDPSTQERIAEIEAKLKATEEAKKAAMDVDSAEWSTWEKRMREELAGGESMWFFLKPDDVTSTGGSTLRQLDDSSYLSTGENPRNDDYHAKLKVRQAGRLTAFRMEALPHESFNKLSRGNGNFVLTEFEVWHDPDDSAGPEQLKLSSVEVNEPGASHWPPEDMFDGRKDTGWAGYSDDGPGQTPRVAVFKLAEPLELEAGDKLEVRLVHQADRDQHNIGRFRLSASSHPKPALKEGEASLLTEALKKPRSQRNDAERKAMMEAFVADTPELSRYDERIEGYKKELDRLKNNVPKSMITVSTEPRTVRVLPRGNWMDDSGTVVEPDIPEIFGNLNVEGRATRLDLAEWLVSERNPVTARVFVNRLWAQFFGEGIYTTLEDIGYQGDWPSHPELLDWLAAEFREDWDIKRMVKLIVMSSTYRQRSTASPALTERDPTNRLLARQQPLRLPAEFIRDNALKVSGLLVPRIGGPSVRPYQPDGYYANSYKSVGNPHVYHEDKGENQWRRGLYTFWKRTFLHPGMMIFDAPNREECTAQRDRSNTPLQALVLLNDPTYVEAARELAERSLIEFTGTPEDRIDWIFREVLSRSADEVEREVLLELYHTHHLKLRDKPEQATQLLGVGLAAVAKDLSPTELAAWTSVTRTVLNLHETITRL